MSLKIALSVSGNFLNKENRAPMRNGANKWAYTEFQPVVWALDTVVNHITSGRAICIAHLKEKRRISENFQSSQMMGVDFDHGEVSVDALMRDALIAKHAFMVYPTASSQPDAPRSRALFALDAPITDPDRYKKLLKRLLSHLKAFDIDEQCKDVVRIFYGSTVSGQACNLDAVFPLAILESLAPHPDEVPKAPREAGKPVTLNTDAEVRRALAFGLGLRTKIIDDAVSTPAGNGERHEAFNKAVIALVSHAKGGWLGFENIEASARDLGVRMGRDEDEIERSIRGAWSKAEATPFELPKDERPNGLSSSGGIIPSVNGSAPATNGGTIPSVNGKQAPAFSAPAMLTWKTSDDAGDSYLKSLKEGRGDNKLPLIFPFRSLHRFGGLAKVMPRGILVGIVGMSGGTKTSFTESATEPYRQMGLHGFWWGIEWTWDQMFARAVQRHGGATVTEKQLHDMWLDEERLGIPVNKRFGQKLSVVQEEESAKVARKIMAWKGKSHQIAEAATDIDAILTTSAERIKELEAQGVEVAYAVFDYMQLMDIYAKMSESERNTAVLSKIKQFCITYNLVGFVVSQVTKAGASGARTGANVLEAEAGQFLRSDKFNLVLTLNPIYAGGLLTDQAIINVAKNSLGSTGQEWLHINPARLQWTDEVVEENDRIKENLAEIAF